MYDVHLRLIGKRIVNFLMNFYR